MTQGSSSPPPAAYQPTTMGGEFTQGVSKPPVGIGNGWAASAIILLTSAMLASASIQIYAINRASALAAQDIVWAISAGVLVVQFQRKSSVPQIGPPARMCLIAFIAALACSTMLVWIFKVRPAAGAIFAQTASLAYMTIPFFTFYIASKSTDVGKPIVLTCHVIVAICMLSILADFTGVASYESSLGRYFGFMGDQTAWALTLPLLVYFCSKRFVLTAAAAVGLALTASRAPALCVAIALILLLLFSRGRRLQYVLTFAAMAFITLFQSEIFATLFGRIRTTQLASSDRMLTARLGLKIFSDSPIFGAGYNSFTYYFPSRAHRLGGLPTQTSTFVQMLSDGGLLLFLPYVAFVCFTTIAGIFLMRRSRIIADSDVINGVVAWLLAMLWINQSAAWFVVGSYVGPLVLGMAGIVTGYQARLGYVLARGAPGMALSPIQQA